MDIYIVRDEKDATYPHYYLATDEAVYCTIDATGYEWHKSAFPILNEALESWRYVNTKPLNEFSEKFRTSVYELLLSL